MVAIGESITRNGYQKSTITIPSGEVYRVDMLNYDQDGEKTALSTANREFVVVDQTRRAVPGSVSSLILDGDVVDIVPASRNYQREWMFTATRIR
jgi:hypothetical protein